MIDETVASDGVDALKTEDGKSKTVTLQEPLRDKWGRFRRGGRLRPIENFDPSPQSDWHGVEAPNIQAEETNKDEKLVNLTAESLETLCEGMSVSNLDVDEIALDFGKGKRFAMSASPYRLPNGRMRMALSGPIDRSDGRPPSRFETHAIAHELGHAIINSSKGTWEEGRSQPFLDEGIAELAAIDVTTRNGYAIDYGKIKNSWESIVGSGADKIRAYLDGNLTRQDLERDMFFDGYLSERGLIHIAGMNFVFEVLNRTDLHKWRFVKENPPNAGELINPSMYLDKYGERLNDVTYERSKLDKKVKVVMAEPG